MAHSSIIENNVRFRQLAEYLGAKAPPGKLPGRQHIDPSEIASLVSHITLIDVVPQETGQHRYRVRLMGSEVVEMMGKDLTGKYVREVLPGNAGEELARLYGEIVRTRTPQYRTGKFERQGREHVHYARVAFPLAKDGENVDMLILLFDRRSGASASGGETTVRGAA